MWSEAPADLEAGGGGQKPLLPGNSGADNGTGTGTAAALDASQSTAIGSEGAAASPVQSPAAPNVNPDALANVKFKTTYVFELDTSAKVFLLLVGVEIAFFIFDRAYINPPADTDALWLLGVMVITAVFFAWFTVRAVWYEMKFDLIVCLIISGLVTVRAILEYTWVCNHATVVCVLLLVVVGIAQVAYLLLGWRVYQQMGRRFFKKARIADPKVHRAFFAYQKLSAVLKLDVVIVIVLIFTGLYYSSKDNVIAGIILSAVFLVSELLWEGVGLYFARKEDKRVSQIFRYVGLVVPAVYLVVLSVLFSRTQSDDPDASGGEAEHSGTSLLSPFTKFITLAALGVANRLLVLWASYNFDKHMGNGLKEHYFDKNLE